MLNLVRKNKLLIKKKFFNQNKIIKSSKHFPSSTREWKDSIYVYTKNSLNLVPSTSNYSMNIIKSYFSMFNKNIEDKIRIQRIKLKFKRLSSNKIYISNGEFKHTNNKVIINLYLFNREKKNYTIAIKNQKKSLIDNLNLINNLITNRLKFERNEGILNVKKNIVKSIRTKKLFLLQKFLFLPIYNNKINQYINIYIEKFIEKYIEITRKKLILYWYYKQLIYINKFKYNYTYLQYLKEQLYKLYNKEIEFNLIDLKRFYLNSDILSESITKKISRNRRKITHYLRNLKNKVNIKNRKLLLHKYIINNKLEKRKNLTKSTSLEKTIIENLKYKRITGFRIEAKGRLTKRYTASRSVSHVKYKGNLLNIDSSVKGLSTVLLKGNLKSNIQYTKLTSKSRIGSFGIKGWVNSY